MAIKELTAQSLADLDLGKIAAAFLENLRTAARDCLQRPADNRKRTVTLRAEITPVAHLIGNTMSCESAKGTFRSGISLPDQVAPEVALGVKKLGKHDATFYFSEFRDSPDQESLFPSDTEEDR